MAASAQYEIDIQMSLQTLQTLKQGGYALYAFKAVKVGVTGSAPLVWLKTSQYLTTTSITWQEEYQAYISNNTIIANGVIEPLATTAISPGQTAAVASNGMLTASGGGVPSAISILNQSMVQWTCGVAQMVNGRVNPGCAVPLSGNVLDVFTPVEKVLLMFSTNVFNTGTVVFQSPAPGLFVDLTGVAQRTVQFDINRGWNSAGAPWARPISPRSELVPLLIQS